MSESNLHSHSRFSDGADSPEEMVLAALGKGFVSLGFSEHAWTAYDSACCIKKEDIPAYYAEIARLKEKYAGKIELYTGFESDYFHPAPKEGLDFTIGSVHYLHDTQADAYYTFDYKPEMFEKCRDVICGGSMQKMVALYYDQVADMAETYRADIVGHLDLIVKLNRDGRFFDEDSTWYRSIADEAVRRIAKTGSIVEVNTGGISRGYRDTPYPSPWLLKRLLELDVPVTISSDAHSAANLDFWFREAEQLLRDVGYRSVKQLIGGKFVDVDL